ncbi:MAG TPA: hypothetical protein VNO54_19565, partial [Streptosporangiaceae bacterium]|nr:hypothetical protein [Streptosporangiaceae bacterium]
MPSSGTGSRRSPVLSAQMPRRRLPAMPDTRTHVTGISSPDHMMASSRPPSPAAVRPCCLRRPAKG